MSKEDKKLVAKLDELFSEYIRKRAMLRVNGCERCGAGKISYKELQAAHFEGRSSYRVRWDSDNAVGICGGCHTYFHGHPLQETEWFKNHIGEEAFNALQEKLGEKGKVGKEKKIRYYKEKLIWLKEVA